MRLGLLTILVGVVFLLKNLGYITAVDWGIVWPIIFIYIGITMITRDRCWHCKVWHDNFHFGKKRRECDDCEVCVDKNHKH